MPVQKLNQAIRDEIFRQVRKTVLREQGTLIGQCLECAWHGYQLLKSWPGAPRTIIQAGSTQWRRLPQELDDGVCPTHFACVWNLDDPVTQLFHAGLPTVMYLNGEPKLSMPEIHVWLACPATEELIDFTTGIWPELCHALLGLDWPAERPPEYLWDFGSRLPEGAHYYAAPSAIEFVREMLQQQDRPYP